MPTHCVPNARDIFHVEPTHELTERTVARLYGNGVAVIVGYFEDGDTTALTYEARIMRTDGVNRSMTRIANRTFYGIVGATVKALGIE